MSKSGPTRTYSRVLRTRGMPAWLAVVLGQRLPVAMSPLALVYLGREVTGSYVIGALLAGIFALAEALFAGWLGRRFDRRTPRAEMRLVLGVQALALLALAVVAVGTSGVIGILGLVALTTLAGGVAAGAHGGLRALLVKIVPPSDHQAALGLESSLTTLLWAASPAVVAALAVATGPLVPTFLMAVLAGAGAYAARSLPEPTQPLQAAAAQPEEECDGAVTSERGTWRRAWPAMAQEGSVMMIVGAAYTSLPALLGRLGSSVDLAGPILAGFAVAGFLGGLAYGTRSWPARYRTQTVVLVVALSLGAIASAIAPVVTVMALMLLAVGVLSTPALAARASGLQELLPERHWAAGFSGLYAAGGLGFGAAGFLVAALLDNTAPWIALAAPAGLAAVVAIVSGVVEARLAATVNTPTSVPAMATVAAS